VFSRQALATRVELVPAADDSFVASLDGLAVATVGLCRRFGRVEALKDVSLAIPVGTTYGLLGPNASGKTTLIRLLAGLLAPSSGKVQVLGQAPGPAAAEKMGYMPQTMALYEESTVWENLRCFAGLQGVASKAQMEETLDLVGLKDQMHRRIRDLSIGMARRACLACALAHRPMLLLLDEPTVGVDPELRLHFWRHFRRLNAEGVTIVLSTHAMDEAERCHRLAILRDGGLLAEGSPADLRRASGTSTLEDAFLRLAEGELASR
jgi:ABC-2 type transport system ATP-binding protein